MCVSTKSANAAISVVMRDDVLVDSTDYRALISNDCRQSLISILNVNIAVYILFLSEILLRVGRAQSA